MSMDDKYWDRMNVYVTKDQARWIEAHVKKNPDPGDTYGTGWIDGEQKYANKSELIRGLISSKMAWECDPWISLDEDSRRLIADAIRGNGHVLIAGSSGSGKTFMLRSIIKHVFPFIEKNDHSVIGIYYDECREVNDLNIFDVFDNHDVTINHHYNDHASSVDEHDTLSIIGEITCRTAAKMFAEDNHAVIATIHASDARSAGWRIETFSGYDSGSPLHPDTVIVMTERRSTDDGMTYTAHASRYEDIVKQYESSVSI